MIKQEITTSKEHIQQFVQSISRSLLNARKNIFDACKLLADLQKNDRQTFSKVKDELISKNILSKTAIYNFTKIGSWKDGFLIKNQENLPLSYKTLNEIAVSIGEDNKKFTKLQQALKTGKISQSTEEKDIQVLFRDRTSNIQPVNLKDEQVEYIEDDTPVNTEIRIIEVTIDRDLLQDKKNQIIKDLNKIKTLMKYASVKEVGKLEQIIEDEYEE
jgi:hypothetical protein